MHKNMILSGEKVRFLRSNLDHLQPCARFLFEARIVGLKLHIVELDKL